MGCVVPPFIAWRPHPPVWRSPCDFPEQPVIETVFDSHSVILSNLHTFRTFAPVLAKIAAFNTPGDPCSSQFLPHRLWPSDHTDTLGITNTPQISSMREPIFGASSVRFRYGPPVCSPPELTGPAGLYLPASLPGLLLPGFQVTRSLRMPAGYNDDAKLRIGSAGLSPVESGADAPALGYGGGSVTFAPGLSPAPLAAFPVPRSPNPACLFPAPGSPVGSCVSHTDRRCNPAGGGDVGSTDINCGNCTVSTLPTVSCPARRQASLRLDAIDPSLETCISRRSDSFTYACDASRILALHAGE